MTLMILPMSNFVMPSSGIIESELKITGALIAPVAMIAPMLAPRIRRYIIEMGRDFFTQYP